MKYLKTYEYSRALNYYDVYHFLQKIIKQFDKNYIVKLSDTNNVILSYQHREDFTEIISKVSFNVRVLIFEIYNPKYELNNLLVKYFSYCMEKVYEKNYMYSFKYDSKTRLKIKDFNLIKNTKNYNL